MKRSIFCTCILAVSLACWIGCTPATPPTQDKAPVDEHAGHDHAGHDHSGGNHGGHDHASMMKYNQVVVEFPGHKHSMEIAEDHDTGVVSAYLTDAHFAPTLVDANEVRLNFVVDGSPKSFTLARATQEAGKPATFTSDDSELAELICDGWKGQATATVEIDGKPNSATMKKVNAAHSHDHGHSHEGHSH